MKTQRSLLLPALMASVLIAPAAIAHGGMYRGPGPAKAGGGATGGGRGAGSRTGPGTGGGYFPTSSHEWYTWWDYNKDYYLYRNRKVSPAKGDGGTSIDAPGLRNVLPRSFVVEELIPTLIHELSNKSAKRELITGGLVALARLQPGEAALPVIMGYLDDIQLYAETAALSLGIMGEKKAVPVLTDLAKDSRRGRRLVKDNKVSFRTRSFALYGLGLFSQRSKNHYARMQVFKDLALILKTKGLRQDVQVAALHAIRLLAYDRSGIGGEMIQADTTAFLQRFIARKKLPELVRAHAVSALALVLGKAEDPAGKVRPLLLRFIQNRKVHPWVQQSAVMGLGHVTAKSESATIKALAKYMKKGKDRHARNLAAIALGRIGGADARNFLYKELRDARTNIKPWIALGLGVYGDVTRRADPAGRVDRTLGDALIRHMGKLRFPMNRAGLAVASGILGYKPAAAIVEASVKSRNKADNSNGYFAEALGLIRHPASVKAVMALVEDSLRQPETLSRAVLALGLLGDHGIAGRLLEMLDKSKSSGSVQAALARALGNVGGFAEARSLLTLVKDKSRRDTVRGFSAVALGLLGERTRWPWHTRLVIGINYMAPTETLLGGGNGVLEIL